MGDMTALLLMSAGNTVLFFSFLLFCRLCKNTLAWRQRYHLELVILLAFLLPLHKGAGQIAEWINMANLAGASEMGSLCGKALPAAASLGSHSQVFTAFHETAGSHGSFLWAIWLLGAVLTGALRSISYLKCCRLLRRNLHPCCHPVYDEVCNELSIKTAPELCKSPFVHEPLLMWCGKHYVLLPEDCCLDDEAMRLVFFHELTHFKRRDIGRKLLFHLAAAVHWFNPFFILIRQAGDRTCELSCDEEVLKRLNNRERAQYGELLLQVCRLRCRRAAGSLSFSSGEKRVLKKRLDLIGTPLAQEEKTDCGRRAKRRRVKKMRKKWMPKIAAIAVVGAICFVALLTNGLRGTDVEAMTQEAENKAETEQAAKTAKTAGDAKAGAIGDEERVVKIPLTELDTLDERFSEADLKKLDIIFVGSKEQAVIDKAWEKIGECEKLQKNVESERLIAGCYSDVCPEDEIKDKGMLVLTFNSQYVDRNMN